MRAQLLAPVALLAPLAIASPSLAASLAAPSSSAASSSASSSFVAPAASAPSSAPAPAALASAVADTLIFVLAPQGNVARFRVREQLARIPFPNDAVGEIQTVSGSLAVTSDGVVIPAASRFIIRVADLATDQDRRDNYLRRNTLNTDTYPDVVFQPTAIEGLTFPLPAQGNLSFRIVGNLTVRDRTVPATWTVGAAAAQGEIRGRAETRFTFDALGLEIPRVGSVLSIVDDIRLEYDFRLRPAGGE
jgi:polyisoprenoid-binding protein YceI